MTAPQPVGPMPSPLSAATLGKVRRMLVARLAPEVLNPFDRTPAREQLVRTHDRRHPRGSRARARARCRPWSPRSRRRSAASDPCSRWSRTPRCRTSWSTGPTRCSSSARVASSPPACVWARTASSSRSRSGSRHWQGASSRLPTRSSTPGWPTARRVNAVLPPVGGPYLAIRKFNRLRLDLGPGGRHGRDWVTEGGLSGDMADWSWRASCARGRTCSSRARRVPARRRSCARSPMRSTRPSGWASSRTRPSSRSRTPTASTSRRSTPTTSPAARPRAGCSTSATSSPTPCGCGPTG